jgi:hypothetical protein
MYRDAEYCLRFLRELDGSNRGDPVARERYHLDWYGPFSTSRLFWPSPSMKPCSGGRPLAGSQPAPACVWAMDWARADWQPEP